MAEFTITRGDTLVPIRAVLVPPTGQSLDLTGASVRFKMWSKRGGGAASPKVDAPAVIENIGTRTVRYDWQVGDTDTADGYEARFVVTLAGGQVLSFPNRTTQVVRVTS